MFWTPAKRLLVFALIIILPFVVLVWRFLLVYFSRPNEFLEARFQPIGLNLILALVWFFFGLACISQFLFPVKTRRARIWAFFCLLAWYFAYFKTLRDCYVIRDGNPQVRIKGNRFSGLAGVVLIDSSSAAVMDDGLNYTRTIGPNQLQASISRFLPSRRSSTFFLGEYEQVRRAIDLRRQMRSRRVQAVTRDGIEVYCQFYVDFEIERDPTKQRREVPYTFSDAAVYRAVYGEAVKKEELPRAEAERPDVAPSEKQEEEYRWTDAVINEGAEELRNIIARRTLDQLYAADDPDREPRVEIEQEIRPALEQRMHAKGAHLLGVTLGVLRAPPEIVEQKVQTWQAEWRRRQTITLAQGEAEQLRRREIARADAQLEMIQSLTQAFQREDAALSRDLVTFRMIQALERMMTSRARPGGTPPAATNESLDALHQLLVGLSSAPKQEGK